MHVVHVLAVCSLRLCQQRLAQAVRSITLCRLVASVRKRLVLVYLKGSYSELYDTALVTPSLRSPADLSIYYIYTIHRFPYRETPYSVPYDRIDILR